MDDPLYVSSKHLILRICSNRSGKKVHQSAGGPIAIWAKPNVGLNMRYGPPLKAWTIPFATSSIPVQTPMSLPKVLKKSFQIFFDFCNSLFILKCIQYSVFKVRRSSSLCCAPSAPLRVKTFLGLKMQSKSVKTAEHQYQYFNKQNRM